MAGAASSVPAWTIASLLKRDGDSATCDEAKCGIAKTGGLAFGQIDSSANTF